MHDVEDRVYSVFLDCKTGLADIPQRRVCISMMYCESPEVLLYPICITVLKSVVLVLVFWFCVWDGWGVCLVVFVIFAFAFFA